MPMLFCPGVFGCASSPSRPIVFGDNIDSTPPRTEQRNGVSTVRRLSLFGNPTDLSSTEMRKYRNHDQQLANQHRWRLWHSWKRKTQFAFRSLSRERKHSASNHMRHSDDVDEPPQCASPVKENAQARNFERKQCRHVNGDDTRQMSGASMEHCSRLTESEAFQKSSPMELPDGDLSPAQSPYVSLMLKIRLKDGKDLVIRDASGSSDPYVKFKYKDRLYYKSNTIFKNLNPVWDEEFALLVDDPTVPLRLEVFDYDRFMTDDYMGGADVDFGQQRLFQPFEWQLELHENNKPDEYMGHVNVVVTVVPQTQEEKESFMQHSVRGIISEQSQKRPPKVSQIWSCNVNIVLVEAKDLLPPSVASNSFALPDPYVKFKLGNEKYKSKSASRTLEPKWLEQFDLHIYEEIAQMLEVMVYDKLNNTVLGRCSLDLSTIKHEVTHQLWVNLNDGAGSILLLLSISGKIQTEKVMDLQRQESYTTGNDIRNTVVDQYNVFNSFNNMRDIGQLTVKVFRATNLAAADINGKSDPFVVVELVNARLQTHTEYKTLNPEWNKLFIFQVKDIHSVLEITVYDEDPNKKVEFLGKIAVPLLKIRNCEKRWYALKDRKLQGRAKGQILLEMDVIWNSLKAAARTFNPREPKYIDKEKRFKRAVLMHNVNRTKEFMLYAVEMKHLVEACFNWTNPMRSVTAFIMFLIAVYNIQMYHVPIIMLLFFFKNYIVRRISHGIEMRRNERSQADMRYFDSEEEEEFGDQSSHLATSPTESKSLSDRSSLRDRLNAISDSLTTIQNTLDHVASLLERIRNTFNFTQPWLSCLAILVLCVATVLLYFVPIRWIVMLWGINKFTKKLRKSHSIPNNELLDFLSRVPCDRELREFCEYRPDPVDSSQAREMFQRQQKKSRT